MARPTVKNKRKIKTNVLICCEGETEENYLHFVAKKYLSATSSKAKLTIKKYTNVRAAKAFQTRARETYDRTFFIFDLDECSNDCNKIPNFTKREQDCKAAGTNWKCFYTYPCIELWFLLHFQSHTAPFTNSGQALAALKVQWNSYIKPMPTNNQEASILLSNVTTAIQNEKTLPSTTILPFSSEITLGQIELTNPMSNIGEMLNELQSL